MRHHFWQENRDRICVGLLIAVGAVLAYFLCLKISVLWQMFKGLLDIVAPIISGAIIAYLVAPLANTYEDGLLSILRKLRAFKKEETRRRLARTVGVGGSMLTVVAAIVLFFVMILPQVWHSVLSMIASLSMYTDNIIRLTKDLFAEYPHLEGTLISFWETAESYVTNFFQQTILPNIDTWVSSVGSGVSQTLTFLYNFVIGMVVAIYMLSSRKQFAAQGIKLLYAVLPARQAGFLLDRVRFADRIFGKFIVGKILDSIIIGAIAMVGTRLLNMPYAVLISVVIGVTNIIPFFGPIIGAVPCVFITLIVDPLKALYLIIFILVLQQVDGNIIGPRILGESTGLSGFWVLFSILLFGGLFGVLGMMIGVPLFAVLYSIISDWVNARLKKKHLSTATAHYAEMEADDAGDGSYLE